MVQTGLAVIAQNPSDEAQGSAVPCRNDKFACTVKDTLQNPEPFQRPSFSIPKSPVPLGPSGDCPISVKDTLPVLPLNSYVTHSKPDTIQPIFVNMRGVSSPFYAAY